MQNINVRTNQRFGASRRRMQRASILALLLAATALVTLLGAALAATVHAAGAPAAHVDAVTFDRTVDPASARFLDDAIARAQHDGATLLVIALDTPGGDLDSMKAITQAELSSRVPIAVYVSPPGGRAGSAGTYIALAAPIAAMAPDTRIGAASPVTSSGGNIPTTEDKKVVNDLTALVQSVQTAYGRNVSAATQTVTNAASYDVQDALSQHLVNLEATSQADLLTQLDGRTVTLSDGSSVTIQSAHLPVETLTPTVANQLESVFLDPNLLFLLFIIAAICIYLELAHPGAIVPGTVGGIALILFLFGSSFLSPNYTGLALMLLSVLLLAADVRAHTHGVLSAGAVLSLVVGSLIFFDTNTTTGTPGISPLVIGGAAVAVALVALTVLRFAIRSQRMPVQTGKEGLIGQSATVTEQLAPDGRVRVLGENWLARLDEPDATLGPPAEPGQTVRVVRVEGLRLIVEPVIF